MDTQRYVELLRTGHVIACPTETQMGLLADALDAEAIERVRALKGRAASEPIGLIVPSLEVALQVALELSPLAQALAAKHWPGPLTLVVRARPHVPALVTRAGTVALRVPGESPAQRIVRAFGGPLTATSANLSGQPPLEEEDALRAAFGAGLSAIVPGRAPGGPPSTIVDATGERPVVLRAGAIGL